MVALRAGLNLKTRKRRQGVAWPVDRHPVLRKDTRDLLLERCIAESQVCHQPIDVAEDQCGAVRSRDDARPTYGRCA